MQIRVGMEGGRRAVLDRARELGAPILISANSLWNNRRRQFSGKWKCYSGFDLALDSGGFVAMRQFGGYRWTVRQYVELAKAIHPTWWAQMDFCCEPELAADRAAVATRIAATAHHLRECRSIASGENVPAPLPVLQGWHPVDYCQGPIYERDYPWPDLVGVGSVCRRQVGGRDGLMAVVEALHGCLPAHVKLHLFGVKSTALEKILIEFPDRVASMDSMAWNYGSRLEALHAGIVHTNAVRAASMAQWFQRQTARVESTRSQSQQLLFS